MNIDQRLQDTVPTDLAPLDHADLQRRGRRRRWMTRATSTAITAGVVAAIGALAVSARPVAPEITGQGSDTPTATSPNQETTSQQAVPDPDVVEAWGELSYDDAIARLHTLLDTHPDRPEGLDSIKVYAYPDGLEVIPVPVGTTDFAVIDVTDEEFEGHIDGGFETPALIPTWTQHAARRALEALAKRNLFVYEGVKVDPLGRTVLVFDGRFVEHQIWMDPASGYTVGARFGDAVRADEEVPEATDPCNQRPTETPTEPGMVIPTEARTEPTPHPTVLPDDNENDLVDALNTLQECSGTS